MGLSSDLFKLSDLSPGAVLAASDIHCLDQARLLTLKVEQLLSFFLHAQAEYLTSLCKFSYVTQRIFLYLIYQGFCGKDDKE
jgi:midasin